MGGANNAFTTEDATVYHFDFAADRWEAALEIEADRMRNLRIDKEHEFEQEKGAVISELDRDEDEPWDLEQKAILPLLFGKKGPYGHPVIGERQHVRGATAKRCARRQHASAIANFGETEAHGTVGSTVSSRVRVAAHQPVLRRVQRVRWVASDIAARVVATNCDACVVEFAGSLTSAVNRERCVGARPKALVGGERVLRDINLHWPSACVEQRHRQANRKCRTRARNECSD